MEKNQQPRLPYISSVSTYWAFQSCLLLLLLGPLSNKFCNLNMHKKCIGYSDIFPPFISCCCGHLKKQVSFSSRIIFADLVHFGGAKCHNNSCRSFFLARKSSPLLSDGIGRNEANWFMFVSENFFGV